MYSGTDRCCPQFDILRSIILTYLVFLIRFGTFLSLSGIVLLIIPFFVCLMYFRFSASSPFFLYVVFDSFVLGIFPSLSWPSEPFLVWAISCFLIYFRSPYSRFIRLQILIPTSVDDVACDYYSVWDFYFSISSLFLFQHPNNYLDISSTLDIFQIRDYRL